MCLICIDFQRGALTTTEAWRNLQEMREGMPDEHYDEVVAMVIDSLYDEKIEADDEEGLVTLLESMETQGQLELNWDEQTDVDFDPDDVWGDPWGDDYLNLDE
jgi:hypothetical protein